MRKVHSFVLMTAIALTGTTAFTACSSNDLEEERIVCDDNGTAGVKSEFVISIPRKVLSITRMSDYVTQMSGDVDGFRGIDNIRLIPFNVDVIAKNSPKHGDIMRLSAASSLSSPGAANYKVYSDQFVPVGTKRFLFYGRAMAGDAEADFSEMDMADKFTNGALNVQGLEESADWTPDKIQFSLEQINTSSDAQANDETGKRIVGLLTDLAKMTSDAAAPNNKWSTTDVTVMASLYKQFTAISTSSSNTLAVILSKLYFALENIPTGNKARKLAENLKAKILTACAETPINGYPVKLKGEYEDYPYNIGLPDGAVRVRWDGAEFKDVTAVYSKDFSEVLTNYCYPAALWYFTNSPLKAANVKKSNDYKSEESWEGVINTVYDGTSDVVEESTQSVALVNAADYGVGRLETYLKMPEGTFYDANGNVVNVSNGYTMKGLLLGGQNSVGYQFTPKVAQNRTIYDRDITNSITAELGKTTLTCNQTLALETDDGQVIYAAIELINNGEDFMGADGIIPANGTFYLVVKLDPAAATNKKDVDINQIIKQDYVTKLVVTIKNGGTSVDRDGDGKADKYVKDDDGNIQGVDTGDGVIRTEYDINGDGTDDKLILDPDRGGPGWDTDNDGFIDIPIIPDAEGKYPDGPTIPDGLGNATNGIPNLTTPGVELGTSVDLEWKTGLVLEPDV